METAAPLAISPSSVRTRTILQDDFFTREELAAELGVTTRTVARWQVLRIGPPITPVGRRILYRKSSLASWLAAQESKSARPQRAARNRRR